MCVKKALFFRLLLLLSYNFLYTQLVLASNVPTNLLQVHQRALHATAYLAPSKSYFLHDTFGNCLAATNQNTVLIGCQDGSLVEWSPNTQEALKHKKCHESAILSMLYLGDNTLITGDKIGTLKVWQGSFATPQAVIKNAHTGGISSIIVLADGKIVTASYDKSIKIWSSQGTLLYQLTGHSDWINHIALLSPEILISSSDDSTIKLWDLKTGSCLQTISRPGQAIYQAVALEKEKSLFIMSCHEHGSVFWWQPSNPAKLDALWSCCHSSQYHEQAITKALFTTYNNLLTASVDHTMMLICGSLHEKRIQCSGHTGTIKDVIEIAPGMLISCGHDRLVLLWQTQEWECPSKDARYPHKNA